MLSAWPLGIESDVSFVYDGFGDDKITFTAYHGDERFQRYKNTAADPHIIWLYETSDGENFKL